MAENFSNLYTVCNTMHHLSAAAGKQHCVLLNYFVHSLHKLLLFLLAIIIVVVQKSLLRLSCSITPMLQLLLLLTYSSVVLGCSSGIKNLLLDTHTIDNGTSLHSCTSRSTLTIKRTPNPSTKGSSSLLLLYRLFCWGAKSNGGQRPLPPMN